MAEKKQVQLQKNSALKAVASQRVRNPLAEDDPAKWVEYSRGLYHQAVRELGRGVKGKVWEFTIDGNVTSEFLRAFAKAGGKFEKGIFSIETTKIDALNKEFDKTESAKAFAGRGSGLKPGKRVDPDWMNWIPYIKSLPRDPLHDKIIDDYFNNFLEFKHKNSLTKEQLLAFAENGGVVKDGVLRVPKGRTDEFKKLLN